MMQNENTNPITKRIVVKARMELAVPALIGSGEGENTDSDIMRAADGRAFLPGTSIAGALRDLFDAENERDLLFGSLESGRMSPLWVLDSDFYAVRGGQKADAEIIEIDGVALNDADRFNKTAKPQAKYDSEAVDAGALFDLRLMLVVRENDAAESLIELFDELVLALLHGEVRVGAKRNRGFGRTVCKGVCGRVFSKEDSTLIECLDFDWNNTELPVYTPEKEEKAKDTDDGRYAVMEKPLRLNGSVMIRDFKNLRGKEQYAHMSANGKPAIFGTSWAGAFKSCLLKWLPEKKDLIDEMFGCQYKDDGGKTVTKPSKLMFDASILEAEDKNVEGYRQVVRVKIDRFTGGASDGALFTSRPWFGGTTRLRIRYPAGRDDFEKLLDFAIDALDKGMLTIGGETAIGRGVFELAEVQNG
ncbi:MAG: RAMP superfamily CRISPR-associated protein [Clostridiales Family XIII bacterium]|nr:RAMP superfamily CRISPR-associated protein [Clostridiales Family XIII bacterium]